MTGTVLVDTNVFTARLQKRPQLAARYAKHVFGQRVAVSPQTVAEARYGALKSAWGPRRIRELAQLTGRVGVLPVDNETIEAVVQLREPVPLDRSRAPSAPAQRRSVDRRCRDPLGPSARGPRRRVYRLPGDRATDRTCWLTEESFSHQPKEHAA
jgi:hypothetical protein